MCTDGRQTAALLPPTGTERRPERRPMMSPHGSALVSAPRCARLPEGARTGRALALVPRIEKSRFQRSNCSGAAVVVFIIIIICFHTVSGLLHVCAPAGGEVLLPCVCSELHRLPQRFTVFWEDKEQRIMLDIISGSQKFKDQHPMFTGRVESFPDLYNKGNVSVLLKNLSTSDTNSYDCSISTLDFKETINLTVSDKCGSGPLRTPPRSSAGDTKLTSGCLHLIMSLTLLFLLLWRPS